MIFVQSVEGVGEGSLVLVLLLTMGGLRERGELIGHVR